MMMRLLLLCLYLVEHTVFAQSKTERNPALQRFSDQIVFYASLDGYPVADLSLGEGEPLQEEWTWEEQHWAPGLWGKALRSDAPAIHYATAQHAALDKSGAVAFWVKPLAWDTGKEPTYIGFVRIEAGQEGSGRQLQMLRMGERVNRQALAAHFVAGKPPTTLRLDNTRNWEKPQWHLFVINWTQGYLEASHNGKPLVRRAIHPGKPPGGGPEAPYISIPGSGDKTGFPYLLDEVLFFARPLTSEEVLWLYQSAPRS